MEVKGYKIEPGANLQGADLQGADLQGADLEDAYLEGANLRYANLRGADLQGAYLRDADLRGADLRGADLRGADLRDADLRGAYLQGAYLQDVDLQNATLPDFQLVPEEGSFIGWKKTKEGSILKLLIPEDAQRTSSLVGRKCRASKVIVLEGKGYSKHAGLSFEYEKGMTVVPDEYDPDIRVECTHGIHFFITRKEAEEY